MVLALVVLGSLVACERSEEAPPKAEGLKAEGAIAARFPPSDKQTCNITSADTQEGPVRSFVFNGAQSSGYVLFFSLFPFEGPGKYPLGGDARSTVVLASTALPTQIKLEASRGSIEVTEAGATQAKGSIDAELRPPEGSATTLSGSWTCKVKDL